MKKTKLQQFVGYYISSTNITVGLYEYNVLPVNEQVNLLWEQGTHLINVKREGKWYVLYRLWDFFVELRYDAECNKLESLRTFRSTSAPEPYLTCIELSDLQR